MAQCTKLNWTMEIYQDNFKPFLDLFIKEKSIELFKILLKRNLFEIIINLS
jgi:hypothetical protein